MESVPKTWVLVLLWHLGQVLALVGLGESICMSGAVPALSQVPRALFLSDLPVQGTTGWSSEQLSCPWASAQVWCGERHCVLGRSLAQGTSHHTPLCP